MTVITEKKAFAKAAVPILATDKKRLPKFLEKLTPEERRWVDSSGFTGAPHTHCLFPGTEGEIAAVLVGVRDGTDPWALSSLPLKLPRGRYALGKGPVAIAPDVAAFSWDLGGYQFTRYKAARRSPAELQVDPSPKVTQSLQLAEATRLVRDLVNTPAEDMGPAELAAEAREQAKLFGGKFREWVGDDLLAKNFPAIHAVGRAAARAPRLIEITWGNPKHPRLAVVGKGVCFDTGGLDMKTAEGMRLMKKDMGGAAHAIALARLVMQRKLPVYLHMLVPAVENNISGNAYRPGDVVRTRQGHTVEIGNTDAEGRVVLCDALAFAVEHVPKRIIDFATLTGAARVALGPELPVMFTHDEKFAARLAKLAGDLDDPMWRLPLWRNYRRLFDSDIADFNNSGKGGFAGAIVGALFLDYFVPEEVSWVHFDVYSWNDISRPGRPLGGEAQGLRAVLASIA
ncbi:leucyl aminopeptidase family protein [Usitatibacter palustris]|uniref:Cytosol aminopeptidase n=1 Tax=Usitatibacter palustris TaxID=2732487 RepID=A0A6M4H8V7_9PROT|nr:leucyl aminopeptidase family protein [Usitatibacter palustris]QJR16011.1 cytosol aminopeptidase [Usitatibacter palustris]